MIFKVREVQEEFMARNNADLAHEIEELIKKYNKKPEKKIKKEILQNSFQQCEVIKACVDYSDCQIIRIY